MAPRTRPCDRAVRSGRLAKAEQFAQAFDIVAVLGETDRDSFDSSDSFDSFDPSSSSGLSAACITLAVHAGIAYADVICCARLGLHAIGQSHAEAVALLRSVDEEASLHLAVLLGMKSRAAYSHEGIAGVHVVKARRAMNHLRSRATTL